jgi:hypothetical protein
MAGNKIWTIFLGLLIVLIIFFIVPAWLGQIDLLAPKLASDWKIYYNPTAGYRINYPQNLTVNSEGATVAFGSHMTLAIDSQDRCLNQCREQLIKKGLFNGVFYEYYQGFSAAKKYYRYRFRTLTGWHSFKLSQADKEPIKIGDVVNLNKIIAEPAEPAFEIQKDYFSEMAKTIRLAPAEKNRIDLRLTI